MEDTLRATTFLVILSLLLCLNPCFNGRYSQSLRLVAAIPMLAGLNPCFNGRYSQSDTIHFINN